MTPQPKDVNNVCHIFKEKPHWVRPVSKVERRWQVPFNVQMAIIHQESHFNAYALPPRKYLLGFIPWGRVSSAYGYSQALKGTWHHYQQNRGRFFTSRESFPDAVDFIGWYAREARLRAGIPPSDAYHLYLAYHEGIAGYMRRTYLRKPWLMRVARKVSARAELYRAQLKRCQ